MAGAKIPRDQVAGPVRYLSTTKIAKVLVVIP